MYRKQGLKTAWKDWPEQGAGKNCQLEQGCQQNEKTEKRGRGQQGRKKGGGKEGQGLGRVGVKDQQALVLGMPVSCLLAASEWHS